MKRLLSKLMVWSGRILAGLSLLLLMATIVVWVWGYSTLPRKFRFTTETMFVSFRGSMCIYFFGELSKAEPSQADLDVYNGNYFFGGDQLVINRSDGKILESRFYIDDWSLCLALGILPTLYAASFIRRRRKPGAGFPVGEAVDRASWKQ